MRVYIFGLTSLLLFAFAGCGSTPVSENPKAGTSNPTASNPTAPKPTAPKPEKPETTVALKPAPVENDEAFKLTVPFEAVNVAQGSQHELLIGIDRGENFRETVAVSISELPAGISMEPANPVIKPGDTSVTLTLMATATAALGDFTVDVTGHTASSSEDSIKKLMFTVSETPQVPVDSSKNE